MNKTTKEQRDLLLKVYLEVGFQGAKRLAIKFGFNPHHLALLARNAGHAQRPVVSQVHRTRQKMWERARANGALVR